VACKAACKKDKRLNLLETSDAMLTAVQCLRLRLTSDRKMELTKGFEPPTL